MYLGARGDHRCDRRRRAVLRGAVGRAAAARAGGVAARAARLGGGSARRHGASWSRSPIRVRPMSRSRAGSPSLRRSGIAMFGAIALNSTRRAADRRRICMAGAALSGAERRDMTSGETTDTTPRVTMEEITALAKRRGFIFQSSEIYGGIGGFFDYGPLGRDPQAQRQGCVVARDGRAARRRRGVRLLDHHAPADVGGVGSRRRLSRQARRLPQLQAPLPRRSSAVARKMPRLRDDRHADRAAQLQSR